MVSGLSSSEVDRMAAESYQEMLAEARNKNLLNTDAAMLKRLRTIADRLVGEVDHFRPDARSWDWEVNLIKSDALNASCMPGGKILFYTGIVDQLRSEEHTSELQSRPHLVCRLLLEKKKKTRNYQATTYI